MPITLNLVRQTRVAGDYELGPFVVPGDVTRVRVTGDIDVAQLGDTTKSIIADVETQQADNSWRRWGHFRWEGAPGSGQPQITIPAPPQGTRARVTLRIASNLNAGLVVEAI